MTNVTGWSELYDGRIFQAPLVLFQSYYGSWFITLLFLTFHLMLAFKTRNPTLLVVTSIVFLTAMYAELEPSAYFVIMTVVLFELAILLYTLVMKKE